MSFIKKLAEKVTPPKTNITLSLSKNTYFLGEDIEGELIVSSDEEFNADEVRCELQCIESAKVQKRIYDPALKHEVTREVWETATLFSVKPILSGPIHISRGFTSKFPFKINIPITMKPTYKGIDRRVVWSIKGVIAVKGRPDAVSQALEIQVAQPSSAPIIKEKEIVREVVMIPCKYCGALIPQTETTCPYCGAKRIV